MQHHLSFARAAGAAAATSSACCRFSRRPASWPPRAARSPVPCRQHSSSRSSLAAATPQSSSAGPSQPQQPQPQDDEFVGLLPEEDAQVPGDYWDALNGNTKLGKAVKAAVQELEHLGTLEHDVLEQCDGLLKQLGMQGSLFGRSGGADADSPLARLQQELLEQEQLEQELALEQAQAEEQQQPPPKEGGK